MLNFLLDTAAATDTQNNTVAEVITYVVMGLFVLAAVLLFIRSSKQKRKEEQEYTSMLDGLQVGDEVTTIGGIIGKVVSIKAETFVLETTRDRTKIRFHKGAIRTIDVKVADIAAQIADAKENTTEKPEEEKAESVAEEKPAKKNKKAKKEAAPQEAPTEEK